MEEPICMNIISRPFQPVNTLFLMLPQTEFSEFCIETDKLWNFEPKIEKMIEADLDLKGKAKKRIRLLDKQWEKQDQLKFSSIDFITDVPATEKIKLKQGRPRMTEYSTFMFMMGRGYYHGIKSKAAAVFTHESMTLNIFLQNKGISMPSANCVYDNINAISNETRSFIFDAQIRMILNEQLDDFEKLTIDSTAVEGNVCWPRDSAIISQLINRTFSRGKSLHKFGMKDMLNRFLPRLNREIKSFSNQINMEAGKPKSIKSRRKKYKKLLSKAAEAVMLFQEELIKIKSQLSEISIEPSQFLRVHRLIEMMGEDVSNIEKVRMYCSERIFDGKKRPSKEKIMSISDSSAAFIQKGNREAVIGYKPQLGRSQNGFITSVLVPLGNASDSGQLDNIIADSNSRTSVIPKVISADDGYVNSTVRTKYLKEGVDVFSFSGSKGKRLLTEEEWQDEDYLNARNDRSAVESLMYTIKYGFNFDRVVRRGIENVRAELLEKVLAYNCCRSIEQRKRQQEQKAA